MQPFKQLLMKVPLNRMRRQPETRLHTLHWNNTLRAVLSRLLAAQTRYVSWVSDQGERSQHPPTFIPKTTRQCLQLHSATALGDLAMRVDCELTNDDGVPTDSKANLLVKEVSR